MILEGPLPSCERFMDESSFSRVNVCKIGTEVRTHADAPATVTTNIRSLVVDEHTVDLLSRLFLPFESNDVFRLRIE